jgi:hypothetical protein
MATDIMETIKQTASEGMILTNNCGNYAKEVFCPNGIFWDEVPESQAPQPEIIDTEHEVVN